MDIQNVRTEMKSVEIKMKGALEHLERELSKIRAGRADGSMLKGIMVDYYGNSTPLHQVANITAPDAHTIAIQPWEKSLISPIEKAIMNANLGFNPDNNGEVVRVNVPPLTEERRRDLVKQTKGAGENAKISIRNARRDSNEELKKMEKEGLSEDMRRTAETEVQELTDKYNKLVDMELDKKEQDIMTL